MSLETEIAALTSEARSLLNYFNNKKAGIDSAVQAAIAAVPESSRSWYVDQVAGLDTNLGTTKESPFKTIDKAIKSTPAFGICTVNLLSDYTFEKWIVSTCAYINITGGSAMSRPKLKPQYLQFDGATYLGGFLLQGPYATVNLSSVDLVFPAIAGVSPAPSVQRLCSFLRTTSVVGMAPLLGLCLDAVTVTMDPTFFGSLIGVTTTPISLNANGVTFPSGFGGKYVSGVASGTDPKTLTGIITNLSAL
ncbi:hypothetical protein ACQKIS_00900 [Pseudomonas fulva]|uniref:hypothetical protein n=1 Tax=Pseudomonas fulva TaxID=47880 RepID=UPI003CFC65E0